jgi:hypothetical protein
MNTTRLEKKGMDLAQFAFPGQTCNNVVLNKTLFLELSHQTLSLGMLTDYDAMAAFDRALLGLSIVTCQRMELPCVAGNFMFQLLKEMSFYLVTGFGQLESFSNNQNGVHGQWVLQGSSSACPIKSRVEYHSVKFVDDTSQFLNPMGANIDNNTSIDVGSALLPFASKNSQIWADSKWISGGSLNLRKCFYYAFMPTVNFEKNSISCVDLPLPNQLRIRNRHDNTIHPIKRVSPSECW